MTFWIELYYTNILHFAVKREWKLWFAVERKTVCSCRITSHSSRVNLWSSHSLPLFLFLYIHIYFTLWIFPTSIISFWTVPLLLALFHNSCLMPMSQRQDTHTDTQQISHTGDGILAIQFWPHFSNMNILNEWLYKEDEYVWMDVCLHSWMYLYDYGKYCGNAAEMITKYKFVSNIFHV